MSLHKTIVLSLLLLIGSASCKKDSPTTPVQTSHMITYQLTANNYRVFSNILFTNIDGAFVSASAEDSIAGWSNTISIKTPYQAILEVQGANSSTDTLSYKLDIKVDGASKASQDFNTPAFQNFDQKVFVILN